MSDFFDSWFKRRSVRVLAYLLLLVGVGVLTLNLSFPGERIKEIAVVQAEKALNKDKRLGEDVMWEVEIEDVSLWWIVGAELHGVTLKERWTQAKKDRAERDAKEKNAPPVAPLSVFIPRVAGRLAPLSSLLGLGLGVKFVVDFGTEDASAGSIDGVAVVKSGGQRVELEFEEVDLFRSGLLQSTLGLAGFGSLDGEVHLELDAKGAPRAGTIDLRGKKLTIGPGEIELDRFFDLTMGYADVPQTNFGNMTLKAAIVAPKGRGNPELTFEQFELIGRDIRMEIWGTVVLAQRARDQRADLKMRMQLDSSFVKKNSLGGLLSFPQLMSGKGKDNWYGMDFVGALKKLKPVGSRKTALGKTPQEAVAAEQKLTKTKRAVEGK